MDPNSEDPGNSSPNKPTSDEQRPPAERPRKWEYSGENLRFAIRTGLSTYDKLHKCLQMIPGPGETAKANADYIALLRQQIAAAILSAETSKAELRKCLPGSEAELSRHEANLAHISEGQGKAQTSSVYTGFADAVFVQRLKVEKARALRNQALGLIRSFDHALTKAKTWHPRYDKREIFIRKEAE